MFAMSTYHVLNIMIFLSLNYDKKSVNLKEIAAFCMLPVKVTNSLLDKLQKHGLILILEENGEKRYLLLKSPYDTRLAEIIFPLEPVLFTDYLGKDKERLPGIQAQLLYQKFRPFQYTMEKKLKRCRLSEWAVMRGCDLYSF